MQITLRHVKFLVDSCNNKIVYFIFHNFWLIPYKNELSDDRTLSYNVSYSAFPMNFLTKSHKIQYTETW